MSKWVPDQYLELILNEIKKSNGESICSNQPLTYYNAAHPSMHTLSTAYVVGDCVRPPTHNGFIYECVQSGTSGGTEPGWGVLQNQEFVDGTVTWKTHENYTLAFTTINLSLVSIEDALPDGKKIVVPQKIGVVTHASGTTKTCALIEVGAKKLHLVTDAETTLPEDDEVVSGRTTIFNELEVVVRDPQ